MEDYAANFIKVNTLNQMNNIKQDKNMIYIKKSKFGITDIKILKKLAIFFKFYLNFIWNINYYRRFEILSGGNEK